MKTKIAILATILTSTAILLASDMEQKEKKLAQDIENLSISDGIVDVYKDSNGQITVYIGGRGSATANLVKISRSKAEDHALRIAEAAASKAFAEFIQKNVDTLLDVKDTITDSSLDVDGIIQKMSSVTENEKLARNLRPEDRAAIMKAVLDTIINNIKSTSGVQSVSTLEVRQKANQVIRGMSLFGSHVGPYGEEVVAVKVAKWSPNSARFAAEAEGANNQRAIPPQKGAEKLMQAGKDQQGKKKPFISNADEF